MLLTLLLLSTTLSFPPGITELTEPVVIAPGTSVVKGHPDGSTLRAGTRFRGSALLISRELSDLRIEGLTLDGNRQELEMPAEVAPYDQEFANYYPLNGIVVRGGTRISMAHLNLRNIVNFPILVNAATDVTIEHVNVRDSGSLNRLGRNNTSGGVLLEEGVARFAVRHSSFTNIRGNGIWTHSRYTSARNAHGDISHNSFLNIGRDAIQIGHATQVEVQQNRGHRIGYPEQIVDVEGGGTPVAIDTAGNVDRTDYLQNAFSEINGKCIDLDGFHNGEVSGNTCINRRMAKAYPHGHYGIVMNNTNPDMQSRDIRITGNTINGTKFGGIFIIGQNHTIANNRLLRINLARCNESHVQFGCIYNAREPAILQSGIYLGTGAERPDLASSNTITGNTIAGHRMAGRCIGAAPDVNLATQNIHGNTCRNQIISTR